LRYSQKKIQTYHYNWKSFEAFIKRERIDDLDKAIERFIKSRFKNWDSVQKHSRLDNTLRIAVLRLKEFNDTGEIVCLPNVNRKRYSLEGPIGEVFKSFLEFKKSNGLSPRRLLACGLELGKFWGYLKKKGVAKIQEIDLACILSYLETIERKTTYGICITLSTLRMTMKYIFEQNFLKTDLSSKIPKFRDTSQPKLPSAYSKEEIKKLLLTMERSSSIGKRNFAITLIAAQLGMRASDICNLKFENLKWDASMIVIDQVKTTGRNEWPLKADIGNAIIDYVKYGRPESDEPYVF
jgi:integrase